MSDYKNLCPTCNNPAVAQCKCPLMDSYCKNGHHWHLCAVHGRVVTDLTFVDHSKATNVCTCPEGTVKDDVQPQA